MRLRIVFFVLMLGSCIVFLGACQGGPFRAAYEPGFAHNSGMTVSVFGVYRDGSMSSDSWKQISGSFSSLGSKGCELAYDDMQTRAPELSAAVDAYARAEGPTDSLLDRIAPAADGELVLLVAISGRPPRTPDGGVIKHPQTGYGKRSRRAAGNMPNSPNGPQPDETDGNVFEMNASLFSVKQHRTVAALSLDYYGSSMDEALAQFKEKFQQELPNARCTGWHWDPPIDPASIKNLEQ